MLQSRERTMSDKVRIDYKTRELGYGTWEGQADAYLTNDVDTWGKRTIIVRRPNGKLEEWYLFEDEYTVIEREAK